MSAWEIYKNRITARGADKRTASLRREARFLDLKIPTSLSYHTIVVNGEPIDMAVINSDNLNIKTLCSTPGGDIPLGGYVEWEDNHWLIIEKDANNELYTRAKMQQCNYLLRWVSPAKEVVERWCIIEDGTKYLTGEYGDNYYVVTRGDSRISMTLPRDKETVKLGRDNRFIIDDYEAPDPLAYRLTKPFKLGAAFNDMGVVRFVLSECNTEDDDNIDLHIADYYKYFPRETDGTIAEPGSTEVNGRRVWL